MQLSGYANHIGRINLSSGEVSYEQIPEDWARKYIGARGLGVRYLLEAGATIDPYSEENLLCFMNGPLTGSRASMSGRLAVVTKSPSREPSPIAIKADGRQHACAGQALTG
jgi:aldehyde:ferredoxin oxidoreductase